MYFVRLCRLLVAAVLLVGALSTGPITAKAGETALNAVEWQSAVTGGLVNRSSHEFSPKYVEEMSRAYPIYPSDLTTDVICQPVYFSDSVTVQIAWELLKQRSLRPATFGQQIYCLRKHRGEKDWENHIFLSHDQFRSAGGEQQVISIELAGKYVIFMPAPFLDELFDSRFGFIGVRDTLRRFAPPINNWHSFPPVNS